MSWIGGDGVPGRKERRAKNNPLNYPIPAPSPLPWLKNAMRAQKAILSSLVRLEAEVIGADWEVPSLVDALAEAVEIGSCLDHLRGIYKAKEADDANQPAAS